MRTEPVVRVQALVKRYGPKTAVDGLTLEARPGVTAVLGPNGAGKTTTVETCEGYREPDSGTVRVLGLDPVRQAAELHPRIGVMLQSGGVYSGARADEMLRHVARLHAHPLDVDALIERLGLGSCGRTTYRRLSGGQQQRLALAMAVVGRPELVFLDEPTAGLDPQARRATWDLIRDLRADGVSVILTTHHMDEAEQLSDDVAIIDAGRVVAQGSPERLCRGGAENTLRFTGRPGLDAASLLKALPADTAVEELTPGSYRVTGKVDPQMLATVTSWCAQHGVMPDRISVERHTLEDVFLELTGKELARVTATTPGTYTPAPGAAPLPRMIAAQVVLETKMLLRNGEQLLLTVVIPALLLALFGSVDLVDTGDGKAVDFLTPGVLALAVMSTAFTGQAIGTGFERRYGVLKRLAASPLPRWGLMTAKTLSVLVTEVLQVILLTAIAFALGWSPHGNPLTVLLLLVLGTAAFSGLGLLMAGTLKAEATLAAANLVFLLLLVGGGVVVPLDRFPQGAQDVLGLLPISALSDGLRDVLQHGAGMPWGDVAILAVWAVAALTAAARFFRWE